MGAAKKRISLMFDMFENICLSLSGGKDSTVMLHLVLQEAVKRNRKINVFFLDQEAEYQATIDVVEHYMQHPNVEAYWFQVPIFLKNATSYEHDEFHAWEPDGKWLIEKNDLAIHEIQGEYPDTFYWFIDWFEEQFDKKILVSW